MAQHDYDIANQDGTSFRADLNAALQAILTLNSGASAPPATAPYMLWADTTAGVLKQRNAGNTGWIDVLSIGAPIVPTGTMVPTAARTAPAGWLLCAGQAVSRTTFASLFAALCPQLGTVTISIASPAVVTLVGNDLQIGERIRLATTGALPTGLAANTDYFVVAKPTADTVQLSATLGGAAINTSGTQSGVHTLQSFAHGAGDGSTTFNLPDLRGRVVAGADAMGGTAANRLTSAGAGVAGAALGAAGGAETHTLTSAQIPAHTHTASTNTVADHTHAGIVTGTGSVLNVTNTAGGSATCGAPNTAANTGAAGAHSHTVTVDANTGGGGAHNNTQPTLVTNYLIKT